MGARPRSWWKNISKTPKIVPIIGLIVVGLIVSFIGGYFFNWTWTGFGPYTPPTSNFQREKTLYDWLQLAIIPVALAIGGYLFNYTTSRFEREATQARDKTERDIATDNQREAALQDYIDKMSELLLDKDHPLRESAPEDEVRKIARVRTLTVLPRLDRERKRSVLQFLYESGLIEKDKQIIDLRGADLREADLREAHLYGASLIGAYLIGANLIGAYLYGANLIGANLREANLTGADLHEAYLMGADLREAYLMGANLNGAKGTTTERLEKAKSLQGATMPDGSIHP
jgi:Pentapeptide repeats (8 copies)